MKVQGWDYRSNSRKTTQNDVSGRVCGCTASFNSWLCISCTRIIVDQCRACHFRENHDCPQPKRRYRMNIRRFVT